ncbi:MAG TPA: SH3 domain-containing protein, partial [Tepidisphaeraceae bacterium]|nr:SH3 domain-containing protein [Tepidisphaeraceae bacterium]
MIVRSFSRAIFTSLVLLSLTSLVHAQDLAAADVENSKFQISGTVNSTAYVRSGASENDYPTMKLDKGADVTVVGERFNWLKIQPPPGSFCYVAKAYVNRAGNGSIGIVTSTLYVRVGSDVNPLKTKVATKLEPNERVEIIGEQDEYFKIKPPAGVYYYINKQFVDPVRPLAHGAVVASAAPGDQSTPPADNSSSNNSTASNDSSSGASPSTQPNSQVAEATPTTAPSTQPTADAQAEFDRLESEYSQATQKTINEQPVEELLAGYQKLSASDGLPESMRRICDFKVNVLKTRAELKAQYAGAQKVQEDGKQRQMILTAEQQEIQDRIKKNDISFYTAVGTLRTSSLQEGPQTLYRLTDPASGRTVIYLRSDDNKLGQYIGQFIGVHGDVASDTQLSLRIITPTAFETVNPAKVGTSVASQIVPASLLPGGVTASSE